MAPPKPTEGKNVLKYVLDPKECPFREFRDNELGAEFWGLGPAAFRAMAALSKTVGKSSADTVWVDEQTQPLPRSVRHYLHGWIKAEELAMNRWEATTVVFEENNGGKMSIIETQLSHAQVLMRSSFCREVLSACFMLERIENFVVEHQWENFTFSMPQEGWRARYHIYSPGTKAGGGQQHRPGLSKNGCYLVRLFFLGAWRCIWVNDKVPVDATDSPLLPFSPLISNTSLKQQQIQKQVAPTVTAPVVHLWPMLLCKALMKLIAPDMSLDENHDDKEDESLRDFHLLHALTGCMSLDYTCTDEEYIWNLLTMELPMFGWDDDDETVASTIKSKSTKKPAAKETTILRGSATSLVIKDTKDVCPYILPGVVPGHKMTMLATMARDVPLKKPLPEPDVALWKHYRWVDWARSHGLYEAYDCPRTKYLKVNGLLKLSHAPHLLDVQSTDSITQTFRDEHSEKGKKPNTKDAVYSTVPLVTQLLKEELREWIRFDSVKELIEMVNIIFYPSMYYFTSSGSSPSPRTTKGPTQKTVDIQAPKSGPLYLQIDSADRNLLRLSLNMLHPRILSNAGVLITEYVEKAYVVIEKFEWFVDCELPVVKVYVETRRYDSVEVTFEPGRHVCRIWVHSPMNWHVTLLSESAILLGTRDVIQCAAINECPWAARFLGNLGAAFNTWIRINRSNLNLSIMVAADREFFKSYLPDLTWDNEETGYNRALLHWMFRQAVQSLLSKKLSAQDFQTVSMVLRRLFCDPDFGMPDKPKSQKPFRKIAESDPCDCLMPEAGIEEEQTEEFKDNSTVDESLVGLETMEKLFTVPEPPITSQVCELATDDLPCGVLKDERLKMVEKQEAATVLQAYWRGTWARKCLNYHIVFTPDVLKILMDNAFGNLEALSALMNEFFAMYPKLKRCFSVSSALSGTNGLHQYHGSVFVTTKCMWIPFFQGVFYCHGSVKVHFDLQSTLQNNTVAIYNNDSGDQLSQAYNSHITFDISPNCRGYTVMGHSSLSQPLGHNLDAHWQLTVLSSVDNLFHVCDNEDFCKELPLASSIKLHIDEIFIPNRRNILGGIQFAVTKLDAVSFRAASSSSDLEMEAILRCKNEQGISIELARCSGKSELYWPYIRLEPSDSKCAKRRTISTANLTGLGSARSLKRKTTSVKNKSLTKIAAKTGQTEPKTYTIEVIGTTGWYLSLDQWKRVCEVRNMIDVKAGTKEAPQKKSVKDKPTSAKDKDKGQAPPQLAANHPQPGDAYVELECSTASGGGILARRDDDREQKLFAAIKSWDAKDFGRNLRGANIRKEFRQEFLVALPPPKSVSFNTAHEEYYDEELLEGEDGKGRDPSLHGPTPASESGLLEMSLESEEEATYLTMPEQLKDKFNALYFVPLCYKERIDEPCVLLTPEKAEAAKVDRNLRIEAAIERMYDLQKYNKIYVLGGQKRRSKLLEGLFVDSQWKPNLATALEERDDAIAQETLRRNLSALKKKQEASAKKK